MFLAEKDFKAWTDIIGLENRFVACEVPEATLKMMTTEALVQTILKYPLNFIYSAYGDPFAVVDLIINNSSLHRELLGRSNAAEVLLQFFAKTDIDVNNRDSVFNRDESRLMYSNEMFFEYLLASHRIPGLNTDENAKTLRATAGRKLAERQSVPKTFSEKSLAPLRILADKPVGGTKTADTWTWSTPLGHSLIIDNKEEMTDDEIFWLTYSYTQNYPTVALHAMASSRYNGHGYAWLITDPTCSVSNPATTSNSWLERYKYGNNQLLRFWDNDFYVTGSSSDYEKVYYSSADHSATYDSAYSPNVMSKWGDGPLMEHAISDCPYSTSGLQYFTIRTTIAYSAVGSITGPQTVQHNNYYQYSFPAYRGVTSWTWSAVDLSTGLSSTFQVSWSTTSPTCTFICYQSGSYKLIFDGKYNNNTIIHKELTIVGQ